ncbi:homeodomain-interacting protein kinase 1-like [Boleophthalmus pectinirostris]|uniref:homeodomain-interacting protein kinase 1-like n=1 Tax=Boleophthalmus pectinirostris TaxID=150288 RepID=UPI0024306447|nr:homeodomain-interacting protein kinase 1-like [Boleophthalmus pectinirostris]
MVLTLETYISSSSSSYEVQQILGFGGFGVVALCYNTNSGQTVALKVLKGRDNSEFHFGQKEAQMLRSLKEKGSESYHIVQWIDSFKYRGRFCHEFERLDISLQEYQAMAPCQSLRLKNIRPIVTQTVGALLFLKSVGVIHSDLKPDNVMLIDHVRQPLAIKLIDFGLTCAVSDAKPGQMIQTVCYRAPEVAVGSSFSESVDMWSVGCIAALNIRMIVQILGQPPKHVLDSGQRTWNYFCLPDGESEWIHVVKKRKRRFKCTVPSLGSIYWKDPSSLVRETSEVEDFDRAVFIDMLKRMLDLDPQTRISPDVALDHPFLTLTHLSQLYREYSLESKRIQLQALDLCRKEQRSTSSTSSSSPETSKTAQGQTSSLKRRREEEESPRKRTKREASVSADSSVQTSGEVHEKSPEKTPDKILLESVNGQKEEGKASGSKSEKTRKRKAEEGVILDSFSHKMKRKDSVTLHPAQYWTRTRPKQGGSNVSKSPGGERALTRRREGPHTQTKGPSTTKQRALTHGREDPRTQNEGPHPQETKEPSTTDKMALTRRREGPHPETRGPSPADETALTWTRNGPHPQKRGPSPTKERTLTRKRYFLLAWVLSSS